MDGRIVLNTTEQRRIVVLNHLAYGALINAAAAELLGISKRQLQRLHKVSGSKITSQPGRELSTRLLRKTRCDQPPQRSGSDRPTPRRTCSPTDDRYFRLRPKRHFVTSGAEHTEESLPSCRDIIPATR